MPKLIPQTWRSRKHNHKQALRMAVHTTTTSTRCFCYFYYHNCPTNLILFQLPPLPGGILPRAHFFVSLTRNSKFGVGVFDLEKPRPHASALVSLRLKVKTSLNIRGFKYWEIKKIRETFCDIYPLSSSCKYLNCLHNKPKHNLMIFPALISFHKCKEYPFVHAMNLGIILESLPLISPPISITSPTNFTS